MRGKGRLFPMSETVSRRRVTSRQSDHIVLLVLLMVVIPAAITLHTVRVPANHATTLILRYDTTRIAPYIAEKVTLSANAN
jgi:hypothetical protein